MWATIGVWVGLAACGAAESRFPKQLAQSRCEFLEACEKNEFLESYDDMEACVEATLDEGGPWNASGCSFDKDRARECLDHRRHSKRACDAGQLNHASCDAVYTGCDLDLELFLDGYLDRLCDQRCDRYANFCAEDPSDPLLSYEGCDIDADAAEACLAAEWGCDPYGGVQVPETCWTVIVCDTGVYTYY